MQPTALVQPASVDAGPTSSAERPRARGKHAEPTLLRKAGESAAIAAAGAVSTRVVLEVLRFVGGRLRSIDGEHEQLLPCNTLRHKVLTLADGLFLGPLTFYFGGKASLAVSLLFASASRPRLPL